MRAGVDDVEEKARVVREEGGGNGFRQNRVCGRVGRDDGLVEDGEVVKGARTRHDGSEEVEEVGRVEFRVRDTFSQFAGIRAHHSWLVP